jgi:uracil-DNA glycosylase
MALNTEKKEEIKKVKDDVLNCHKCLLREERDKNKFYPVIGEGNHQAEIMFVGEAPGLNEAKTARPFCGAAGRVLNELFQKTGIEREEVYITNILKDRPPGNRDPFPEEIKACTPYLEKQIEAIKPKIICSLGRYAAKFLMEKFGLAEEIAEMGKIHGKVFNCQGKFKGIAIIPLYHPAVAVYNANMKSMLEEDFIKVKETTNKL